MLRLTLAAAALALASAGDQFCFDQSGKPTLPGQNDPPARVDEPPVEVPLQGSSPEGRGCAIA